MGVTIEMKTPGDGKNFPKQGDKLEIHYVGTLAKDKTVFDSSRAKNKIFECTIGVGQVIKGWDEGLLKMSMGERSMLHVSSDLAYGEKGSGGNVPPNADLDFDIELIAINGKKHYSAEQLAKYRVDLEKWSATKLKKYDDDSKFREQRDQKHKDRAGYAAWLNEEVEKTLKTKKSALLESKPKPKAARKNATESKEVQVLWEDQARINEFGRLNHRLQEVNDDIEKKKNDVANLGDVAGDIEVLLDDDACKIKVGEVFVTVSNEEAEEFAQEELKEREEQKAVLITEKEDLEKQMRALKALLYAKFGNQINLETDPQE
jgi:FK506-binding protein 1